MESDSSTESTSSLDNTSEAGDGTTASPAPNLAKGPYRRQVALFVAKFLVIAFVLMAGYRYATPTRLNHAYLYSVASHTCMALRLVGDSCSLERPDLYEGREAEIRALLAAPGKPTVAAAAAVPDAPQAPLSPWEVYRYRALNTIRNLQEERERLADLSRPLEAPAESSEKLLEQIYKGIEELDGSVMKAGPKRTVRIGPPEVVKRLPELRHELEQLAAQRMVEPQALRQALLQMHGELRELRGKQEAFVRDRVAQFQSHVESSGPSVHFVAEAAPEPPDSSAAPPSGSKASSPKRSQGSFTFIVVPDCGAIEVMALFTAAVVAFPALWRKRILGLLAGLPVLYLVNIGRLSCLGYLGAVDTTEGRIYFDFVHNYVWQGVYIIFVGVVFLLWVGLMVKPGAKAPAPRSA